MNKKQPIVILGAGLTGLSTAFFLKENYQIFEKEERPGGLCRSRKIKDFTFDYDGHLLHFKDRAILHLVQKLMGDNLVSIRRNSTINSFGRQSQYPFQANLFGLPKDVIKECVRGFIDAQFNGKIKRHKEVNFKQWILANFGSGIAKHFMLPYNNKFWTIPADRLSCEWVEGYIPLPTLQDVLNGTIAQSRKQFGYNARFWYPRHGGIEKLIFALQRQINSKINTLHQAVEIDLVKKTVSFQNGRKVSFNYLISTLPLPELLKLIPNLPVKIEALRNKLKYTSVFCLNLGVAKEDVSNKHWIYFPEKKFAFFRVGFPTNFSSSVAPSGRSSLYVEVAYSKNKPPDKDKLMRRILRDLYKAGILSPKDTIEVSDPLDIKYGYIIYDRDYKESTEIIHGYLNQHQVFSIGRYGRWKYISMEDAILEGKETARLLEGRAR